MQKGILMRKLACVFVLLLIVLTGCAKKEIVEDGAGGNMQYDSFRGSSSSVVNRVQYEAFSKCLRKFDFSKYKGKVVNINISAGNPLVTEQIKALVNVIFVKNGIFASKKEYDNVKELPPKYDYSLDINAVCGGYHVYPGFILYNFKSTARLIMLESTPAATNRYYDSGYQESSLLLPVFTDEFRASIYVLIFSALGLIAYRFGLFKREHGGDKD
jgi:hypothetical protein